MNVKISTILEAQPALEAFARKDLSITTSFKVAKLIKAVNTELEAYNEQRIKLLESIGSTLSEDGKQYQIPMDKRAEFAESMDQLVSIEVTVPDKINISGEKISISPDILLALEAFVEIDEV